MKSLVQKLVQKHFKKAGTIRKKCVYVVVGEPGYNDTTNEPISNNTPYPDIFFIFYDFNFTFTRSPEQEATDEPLLIEDRIAILPALDMLNVVPRVGDNVIDDLLKEWEVIGLTTDPADAHYRFHVRPLYYG